MHLLVPAFSAAITFVASWLLLRRLGKIGIFRIWVVFGVFAWASSAVAAHWLTVHQARGIFILTMLVEGWYNVGWKIYASIHNYLFSFLLNDRSPPTNQLALRVLRTAQSFYAATYGGECLPAWLRKLRFSLFSFFVLSLFWLMPLTNTNTMNATRSPVPVPVWIGIVCYLLAMALFVIQWHFTRQISGANSAKGVRKFWLNRMAADWGGVDQLRAAVHVSFHDIPQYGNWMAPLWRGDGLGIVLFMLLFLLGWWTGHTIDPHGVVPNLWMPGMIRAFLLIGGLYVGLLSFSSVPEWRNFGQKECYFPLFVLSRVLDEFG